MSMKTCLLILGTQEYVYTYHVVVQIHVHISYMILLADYQSSMLVRSFTGQSVNT